MQKAPLAVPVPPPAPPPIKASGRRLPRLPKSCGECRRRKQKCILPAPGKPCLNCAKRWPTVACTFPRNEADDSKVTRTTRVRSGNVEVEVTSSRDFQIDNRGSGVPPHPLRWSVYVLPGDNSGFGSADELQDNTRRTGSVPSLDSDGEENDETARGPSSDESRPKASLVICGRGFSGQPVASVGGILSAIHCVNSEPVENTARNTELMYFFLQFVAPNLVSIDGESMPMVFRMIMLPWMLQSHLFPNIAILMASVVQVLERGQESPETSSEPLAIKTKVLGMINRVLTRGGYDLSDVLRSIINLVMIEWFWGAHEGSMWAHLRGLRELVNNHGGQEPLIANDPIFAMCLQLADYAIACGFEADLCVQNGQLARKYRPPCPDLPDACLACPLGDSHAIIRFMDLREKLHLSEKAAMILDDIQFLTISINCPERIGSEGSHTSNTAKIQSTAAWMHKRLQGMASITDYGTKNDITEEEEEDLVTETIRLTALIYTDAIQSLRPISQVKGDEMTKRLCDLLRKVSSSRWKMIPGIFLWLVAVATPQAPAESERDNRVEMRVGEGYGDGDMEKQLRIRYLRRKLGTAAQVIGQEQYPLAIFYFWSYWMVQRWIAERGQS